MIEAEVMARMVKLAVKRMVGHLSAKQLTRHNLNELLSSAYLQGAYDMGVTIMNRWPEVVEIINDSFKDQGAGI